MKHQLILLLWDKLLGEIPRAQGQRMSTWEQVPTRLIRAAQATTASQGKSLLSRPPVAAGAKLCQN